MHNYQIEIKPTNNPTIIQFEADRFLVQQQSFEFANIDEATDSPLAQQLFHLPFVKKVYIAQNFIAIQRYDNVVWEDVQEEVASIILEYLNGGKRVIKENDSEPTKKHPVTVYAENTPNPAVMKFVSNKKLVVQTVEFKNSGEAKNGPMAQALFQFPFVKEVFFDTNFISVNKHDFVEWGDITMELREFIRTYLEEGKMVIDESSATNTPEVLTESSVVSIKNLDDTSKEIVSILNEYIQPAVASDGGNIVFQSYDPETKKVQVILQGACSGCPSSTQTLKMGIENMLKEMLAGRVETVEAFNG